MKEMKLPFVSMMGENIDMDLVSTLAVSPQLEQPCVQCNNKSSAARDDLWMLEIDAGDGNFSELTSRFYCPDCARKRTTYLSRRRECELEMGSPEAGTPASERADRCVDKKTDDEGE